MAEDQRTIAVDMEARENIKRKVDFIGDGGRLVGGIKLRRSGGEGLNRHGPNSHTTAWLVSQLRAALALHDKRGKEIARLKAEIARSEAGKRACAAENEDLKAANRAGEERRRLMVARGYRDEP
jgi:hypothetical protein